jgi:hypothetical protein
VNDACRLSFDRPSGRRTRHGNEGHPHDIRGACELLHCRRRSLRHSRDHDQSTAYQFRRQRDAGKPIWLSFTGQKGASGSYAGTVYRTSGAPFSLAPTASPAASVAVGSATLTFGADGRGTFAYEVNGVSRTKAIERQQFTEQPPICD